ncbi:MAG: hypothetical protein IID41_16500 [Planctomycetes bacterium]|nr:hypothetical protein [Planctomycetota bacterium]
MRRLDAPVITIFSSKFEDLREDRAKDYTDQCDEDAPLCYLAIALGLTSIRRTALQLCCGRKEHCRRVRIEKAGLAANYSEKLAQVITGVWTAIGPIPDTLKARNTPLAAEDFVIGFPSSKTLAIFAGYFGFVVGAVLGAGTFHQEMAVVAASTLSGRLTHPVILAEIKVNAKQETSDRSNAPDMAEALAKGK